ncbi:MAG: ADP-ribosylglycohydrolase family protein [Thermogemmata sp.]|jgi:hypothetical protein|uniref:ADP-ribosylglycohydrolase family protein n=1 Tax=Thermogemmata fonticola TaxID=2755323 RepID=A0A7V8VFR3_9BACT|nr:ADP-ribosylglycohydrolase family protein [Thermogemmata fonticola]MBA2227218.1 ADP-ribosylglycohydrolase family protein [Thermogemmata fonticola]MCX8138120.1 ADP-ribosylglycohydrolase family protein [Gemmataceae bacterium]
MHTPWRFPALLFLGAATVGAAVTRGATVQPEQATPPAKLQVREAILTRQELYDRIYGGWLGMLIGNLEGLPHEFKYLEQPRDSLPQFTFLAQGARSDDDSDIELTHLYFMARDKTLKLPYARIAEIWKANMNTGVWRANKRARALMEEGLLPPQTGDVDRNEHAWYNLSAQFCTEAYGLVCPGMPQLAAELGLHYAKVAVSQEPLQAAQFWPAFISLCFVDQRPIEQVLESALPALDRRSSLYAAIRDARAAFRQHPQDWKAARQQIHQRWYRERGWNDNATPTNGALIVLALLYGQDDFYKTLQYAMALGYDADCNAATAGCILGVRWGQRRLAQLPQYKVQDIYLNRTRPQLPEKMRISEQADLILELAERAILQQGGKKVRQQDSDAYAIAAQEPRLLEPLPDQPRQPPQGQPKK